MLMLFNWEAWQVLVDDESLKHSPPTAKSIKRHAARG